MVRHEWLDLYDFETIEEVQQIATDWPRTCNNERPNMGIGGRPPAMKLKKPPEFYGRTPLRRRGWPLHRHLSDLGGEGRAIHSTLDDPWRDHLSMGQPSDQGLRPPVSEGRGCGQPRAAQGSSAQACQVGFD